MNSAFPAQVQTGGNIDSARKGDYLVEVYITGWDEGTQDRAPL